MTLLWAMWLNISQTQRWSALVVRLKPEPITGVEDQGGHQSLSLRTHPSLPFTPTLGLYTLADTPRAYVGAYNVAV